MNATKASVNLIYSNPECTELGLGANEDRVESLWVRIKGQAPKADITVGVYYRPPDQEEEVDEASTGSCKQPHSHRPWFSWGTSTTLT